MAGSVVFVDLQTSARPTGPQAARTILVLYETQPFALPHFSNWMTGDGYKDGFITMKGSRANLVMELSHIKDVCPYYDVTVVTTDPELEALVHARFKGWTVDTKDEEAEPPAKKARYYQDRSVSCICGFQVPEYCAINI